MNEIEVKARVQDIKSLIAALEEKGFRFSDPITQHNFVFTRKGIDPTATKTAGNPVLRICDEGKRILFTLKQDREDELDCIEKEIEVGDKEILRDILDLLGFEQVVEIQKTRRKAKHNDFEICVDEVIGLGSFIEVEKFSDEPGEKIKAELWEFLKSLGIKESHRVMHGYDTLIYEKMHQKKN
ncbi:MAG: class IV adenylate cyclase [Patescibacteria group bacterium]|nr:class IV adenylate cyclase [Patescibacteria group bacterium]